MTFLSKLGQAVLKGVAIVSGIAPVVSQTIPGASGPIQIISQDLTQIADIITQIEAIGQALGHKGEDKLNAAQPLIAQVILKSTLLVNHKIANPDLFSKGTKAIAGGMADVLNSLHENGVKTEDKKS